MSLISEASLRAVSTPDFYALVNRSFVNSYLAMLFVNGLTTDLANIILANEVRIEEDEFTDTLVLHIGSVKLQMIGGCEIGVSVSTHDEPSEGKFTSALFVTIWQIGINKTLTAEFILSSPSGTNTFSINLPATLGHPFTGILIELKRIITNNANEVMGTNLKAWAGKMRGF